MSAIKNIIFDLGGVLYAIDYDKIESGMATLQHNASDPVHYSRSYQDPLFTQIEVGKISPDEFFEGMRIRFQLSDDKDAFFRVWNSMLHGLIPGRLELVKSMSAKYRVFLLSNTNIIHYTYLISECAPMFACMEKCYFSHEVGLRKPNPEIFNTVLEDNALIPEETLFIEDSIQHINAANSLGIKTLFVQSDAWPDQLHDMLNPFHIKTR
jgi:glucose-1-phosphatase